MTRSSVNISFRLAGKPDLLKLHALELDAFGEPAYPIFLFRQAMDLWPQLLWVASQGDDLLAYVLLAPAAANPHELSLMSFGIASQAQGQGLGKRLLAHIQTELMRYDPQLQQVWLTVKPSHTAAVRLYQNAGFVETAREFDYYGPDTDRMVLTWHCQSVKKS